MNKILLATFTFFSISQHALGLAKIEDYKDTFKTASSLTTISIPDPISDEPINTSIIILKDKKHNIVGYVRDITTTTGCNSECLPVIFTLFYNDKKMLLKLKSKAGLTKKYHARFTSMDYQRLELILALNPKVFETVGHPTQMVDALSGATKAEYVDSVVKDAAYTSLRVNRYNQHTLNFLKNFEEKK